MECTNVHMDACSLIHMFELPQPPGALSHTNPPSQVQVSAISPMRFRSGTSSDLVRLGMMVLVFVMVIYYLLEELDLCRASGLDRYKV